MPNSKRGEWEQLPATSQCFENALIGNGDVIKDLIDLGPALVSAWERSIDSPGLPTVRIDHRVHTFHALSSTPYRGLNYAQKYLQGGSHSQILSSRSSGNTNIIHIQRDLKTSLFHQIFCLKLCSWDATFAALAPNSKPIFVFSITSHAWWETWLTPCAFAVLLRMQSRCRSPQILSVIGNHADQPTMSICPLSPSMLFLYSRSESSSSEIDSRRWRKMPKVISSPK